MKQLGMCFLSLLWLAFVGCPSKQPATVDHTLIMDEKELSPYQIPNISQEELYDKILGALLGSAIGDAMGAPTEMWARRDIQLSYGHVDGLDGMVREPSAEGTWGMNLDAGGTTDDTRWKRLMVDFFKESAGRSNSLPSQLESKRFAHHIVKRYQGGLDRLKALDQFELEPYEDQMRRIAWLKEWAMVAKPYTEDNMDAYANALHRFYGGEMVCAGMLFSPMVGVLYPGNPEWAYQQAFQIDIFDLGYAKDISGLVAAMVSEAMRPGLDTDSLLELIRKVDPQGYFSSRLVGRTAYKIFQTALYISNEAKQADPKTVLKNPPVKLALGRKNREDSLKYARFSVAYSQLDQHLNRYPFHPAEVFLINLTALLSCDFDFQNSLEFVINFGRDNDTVGAVTGAILGALHGANGLPPKLKKQVLETNRKMGLDLEVMAQSMLFWGETKK